MNTGGAGTSSATIPRPEGIVHGEDGRIQDEWMYGKDPRNVPG